MVEIVTQEDIAGWDADLQALTDGLSWMFNRPEPKRVFGDFIRGLLSDAPKKNAWGLADHLGYTSPISFQHLLYGASWDADVLRDQVRSYVVEALGDGGAALVLDDTQAQKKGVKSVGVAFQHCGLTGDTRNCQVMVMLTYSSVHGHAFIDRELYLPAEWTSDPVRLKEAGVPHDRVFATKPQLAVAELARAIAAGMPFSAMVADSGYGRDPGLRAWCHEHSVAYAVGVPVDLPLVGPTGSATRPDRVHRILPAGIWERRTLGAGSKGERFYDWACIGAQVKEQAPATGFEHKLLIRKSREPVRGKNGKFAYEFAYFLVHAPLGTTMSTIMRWLGLRWSVEEDNKQGKDVFGLDGYQVRKWVSWYRHVTCSMLAHAFTAVKRAELGKEHGGTGEAVVR
jgi:SRSO17 transposase